MLKSSLLIIQYKYCISFDDCRQLFLGNYLTRFKYSRPTNPFSISFNAVSDLPFVEFYMSGSAFDYRPSESGLGKKIGEIKVSSLYPGTSGNEFRFTNQKIVCFYLKIIKVPGALYILPS